MPRSSRLGDTIGAIAGVPFAFLLFLSVAAVDSLRGASDEELQTWWADSGNRNNLIISLYALLLAGPLFLLFVTRLRTRVRAAGETGWPDAAFASGIVVATALGVVAILRGIIAATMRFGDEPLPGVDTLRFQTSLAYATWDLVILFAVVLVAVTSIMALTTRVLPHWIGWLGVPFTIVGAILLATHRAPLSIPLLIIWVLANSVYLLRTPAPVPAAGPIWQPGVSGSQA